jgi:hypothetical protein
MAEVGSLMDAMALGISMLASEHFFSSGMSSPWSVAKFATTEEDKAQVWHLFSEAAGASVITAIVLGLLLKDESAFWWSVGGTVAIVAWMWYDYYRALQGTL